MYTLVLGVKRPKATPIPSVRKTDQATINYNRQTTEQINNCNRQSKCKTEKKRTTASMKKNT